MTVARNPGSVSGDRIMTFATSRSRTIIRSDGSTDYFARWRPPFVRFSVALSNVAREFTQAHRGE
jgi:hypothetical protein